MYCVVAKIINYLVVQNISQKNVHVIKIKLKIITYVGGQIFHENLNNICILFQYILTHYDGHKYHIHN